MGNTTSTPNTKFERYLEAIPFVPDALQDRIQAIEPWQLSAELDRFGPETSMSAYWIAVLQKANLLDWSDLQTVFAKCIEEIPHKKSSIVYMETLVEHILQRVQSEVELAQLGTYWIIELANAVSKHPECWELDDSTHIQNPVRLHQAAANALDAIDRQFVTATGHRLSQGVLSFASGQYLFDSHEVYKSLDLFIRAGFDQPTDYDDHYYDEFCWISYYDRDR